MPTEIKQVRDDERGRTVLRVNGEMYRDDALLLGRIADQLGECSGDPITLDLGDLDLLDSDAAHVLRGLAEDRGYEIVGMDVFVQSMIDEAERLAAN